MYGDGNWTYCSDHLAKSVKYHYVETIRKLYVNCISI